MLSLCRTQSEKKRERSYVSALVAVGALGIYSILGSISGFWVLHLAAASFLLKEGKNIFPLTSMMHRLSFENIPCQ